MSQQPYFAANAPIVVQGTVVHQQHQQGGFVQGFNPGVSTNNHVLQQQGGTGMLQPNDDEWVKGEHQPKRCNDMLFALLFYAHLGVIGWCTATFVPTMFNLILDTSDENTNGQRFLMRYLQESNGDQQASDDGYQFDDNDLSLILGIAGVLGFTLSSMALGFMMLFAEFLIKMALFFNVITSLIMALVIFAGGDLFTAILFLALSLLSAYYAYCVWARIPFAAANMTTAITAVRANFGVTFFAYISLFLNMLWSIWWVIAFMAVEVVTSGCYGQDECEEQSNGIITFLLFISFFWTTQVIKNVVHVTVAGTVGTWWFEPRTASSCCSRGVRNSWLRAMTSSFGSICFGSLIVAILQALKQMMHSMREQGDSVVACLAECLLGCIESLVEYFNTWAFTYVGLYGYSFMDAGKNVMTLFRSRGWTTIITDNLIDTCLLMVSVGVGVLTGIVGLVVGVCTGMDLASEGVYAFLICLMIGLILCATLFSVVSSAVNTVIVCYAEAPAEFHTNHPLLAEKMQATWRQAYPNEFHY